MLRHILIAVILVTATVSGGVVAQEDDSSFWDDFTNDEDDGAPGGLSCIVPFDETTLSDCNDQIATSLDAQVDRATYSASTALDSGDDEESAATDAAAAFAETFNDNSDTLESYANQRFTGNGSEYNVIQLDFQIGDTTQTRYLVADVSGGEFANSSVVEATDRDVDHTVVLHDFAAREASDELSRFVTEYAEDDEDIDSALEHRMASRYLGHIDAPEEVRPS
ncbi:hypothetical protein C2R22_24515 (plasmid) [Salinigranum rubrum]|uniref:Uncharacterized protein n=1 Tax=Salinigranum rubrum TaxID=755307 RepID=A0A2I8VS16_9EURY|nr:hypothetical protein [Salinigranum rubrum]AUV84695.1 hypothetical protein C2R22_24515 [Salinigranum rubrum]